MAKKLTPMMEKYAEYRAQDFSQYSSALKAGYARGGAANMGSRLEQNLQVQALISKHKQKMEQSSLIDAAWVVAEAVDTYRRAREAKQNAAALTALTLLAKHTGGFDGGENAQTTNYNLILAGLTPEEIREIAKRELPSDNSRVVKVEPDVIDGEYRSD